MKKKVFSLLALVLFMSGSSYANSLLLEKQEESEADDICYEIAGNYIDSLAANEDLQLDVEFLIDAYFETLGQCQKEWN